MKVEMYPNPEFGKDKSIYLADPLVAELPGVRGAVLAAAMDKAAIAEATLAGHFDTGNSSVFIEGAGGPDVLVGIWDPKRPNNGGAAMGIERETNVLSSTFGIPPIRPLLGKKDTGFTFTQGDGD